MALALYVLCIFNFAHSSEFDVKSTLHQVGREAASPVTTDVAPFFWSGAAVSLILSTSLKDDFVQDVQDDFQKNHHLGDTTKFGDAMGQLIPNALYVGGQWAAEKWWTVPEGYQRSLLMIKATAYSVTLTTLLKYTVREKRPNGDNRLSFPSGHTTTAFAFASVVGAEHSIGWGVGAYSLATLVGLSRIDDNKHYLNDVIAGAVIGTSYGLGLHSLLRKQQSSTSESSSSQYRWSPKAITYLPTSEGGILSGFWTF